MAIIRSNVAKEKLASGQVATGIMGNMTSEIIDFVGPLGFDAAWIECEHGSPSWENIRVGLSLSSILAFATAEIKQNEPGLIELTEKYGVPLYTYSVEALNNVFSKESDSKWDFQLDRSEKAHNLLGVWGVSEPSSILAADSVDLVMSKRRSDCATVAVTRIKEN